MKTLILNGSPHKTGNVTTILNEMIEYLEGDVKIVSAYHDNISPCTDCLHCHDNVGCIIQDDMQEVYAYFEEADSIVLVSPIHMNNFSGPLVTLLGRLYIYQGARIGGQQVKPMKRKHGGLILTGGREVDENPWEQFKEWATRPGGLSFDDWAKGAFKRLGAECVGEVMALNTYQTPAIEDRLVLSQARELARQLNNSFSVEQGNQSREPVAGQVFEKIDQVALKAEQLVKSAINSYREQREQDDRRKAEVAEKIKTTAMQTFKRAGNGIREALASEEKPKESDEAPMSAEGCDAIGTPPSREKPARDKVDKQRERQDRTTEKRREKFEKEQERQRNKYQ